MADYSAEQRAALAKQGKAIPIKDDSGNVVDGSYPIANKADLQNAIQAFGRAGNKAEVKAHIIKQAKALGASDLIPENWTMAEPDLRSLYFVDGSDEGEGVSKPFEMLRVGKTTHPSFGETEITEADLDKAVQNFNAMQSSGAEVPVDYDHSFAEGGESRAAGWIKELFRQGKSLFARVKWTDAARKLIGADEYRYISAEFSEDWKDEFGDEHGFTLLAAGLTNRPFLKGMTPVALSERIPVEEVRFAFPISAPTVTTGANTSAGNQNAITWGASPSGYVLVPALDNRTSALAETPPEVAEDKTVTLSEADHKDLQEKANAFDESQQEIEELREKAKKFDEAEAAKEAEGEKAKTLSEANTQLSDRVSSLESELLAERRDSDLNRARREGRIDISEETTTKWTERYEKLGRETAKELLFEMPADTIPMKKRGGEAAEDFEEVPEGTDPESFKQDRLIKARAEDKGISYSEALEQLVNEEVIA